MMPSIFSGINRRGVAIFAVLGVVGVMAITAIGYNAYSSGKRKIAQSLLQSTLLESLCESCIDLGFKKLNRKLQDPQSEFYPQLVGSGQPGNLEFSELEADIGQFLEEVVAESNGFFATGDLSLVTAPTLEFKNFRSFKPSNEQNSHGADSCEKYGEVALSVTLRYKNLQKTKSENREMKVVSLVPPVVSKFTLFVADFNLGAKKTVPVQGGPGRKSEPYNTVALSEEGAIPQGGQRPLILFNTSIFNKSGGAQQACDNSLFEAWRERGWIYLNAKDKVFFKRAGGISPNSSKLISQIFHGHSTFRKEPFPAADKKLDDLWQSIKATRPTGGTQEYRLIHYNLGYFYQMFDQKKIGSVFPLYYPDYNNSLNGYRSAEDLTTFLHLFGCAGDRSTTRVIGPIYDQYLVMRAMVVDDVGTAIPNDAFLGFLPFVEEKGGKLFPTAKSAPKGYPEFEEDQDPMRKHPSANADSVKVAKDFVDQWEQRLQDPKKYLTIMSKEHAEHFNEIYTIIHEIDKGELHKITIEIGSKKKIDTDFKKPGEGKVEIKFKGIEGEMPSFDGDNSSLAKLDLLTEAIKNKATYILNRGENGQNLQKDFEAEFIRKEGNAPQLRLKNAIIYVPNKGGPPLKIPDGFVVKKDQSGMIICDENIEIGSINQQMESFLTIISINGEIKVNNGSSPLLDCMEGAFDKNSLPPKMSTHFPGHFYTLSLVALGKKGKVTTSGQGSLYNFGNIAVKTLAPENILNGGILQYNDMALDPTREGYKLRYSIKINEDSDE